MADYYKKVLMDAMENLYVQNYSVSSSNFLGAEGPPWRIDKFALKGGRQDGVDLVQIDNGHLTVVIVPTRGMAVLEAYTEEVSLGWNSPVREIVHPAYVNEESEGGLGWLEGFNELVTRCGLAFNGAPGTDVVTDNTGAEQEVSLPLHGTIANSPAARLSVSVRLRAPYELSVTGEVWDTRLFGSCHYLSSTVSTTPGSAEFSIRDVVQNLAGTPSELELLYHCNFGRPLLGQGARVEAPVDFVCPRDARAREGIDAWETYGPPEASFAEQCYYLRNHADEDGRTVAALVDAEGALAAAVRYSVAELPALTVWKNTAAEPDGYVTGLEPGTDYPNSRRFERSKGRVVELEPEESYRTHLRFGLVEGAEKVRELHEEIAGLAEGKESTVAQEPVPEYCPG